jgi:hypothetical protein
MTLPQRWATVAKNNTCEICLTHNRNSQCSRTLLPGGAPPCSENGCLEIHASLLHEPRGYYGNSGTLWEDEETEETMVEQLEETKVEQDVSVSELHTQDHVDFSNAEPSNKNGEIVPFLLIDGSASSSGLKKNENVKNVNENIECFSIAENAENDENEIAKTEKINEEKEPDVADAVGSGAVALCGAGIGINSDDDIYEDVTYQDSDSGYVNTAHNLNRTIMMCQTVCIKDKKKLISALTMVLLSPC